MRRRSQRIFNLPLSRAGFPRPPPPPSRGRGGCKAALTPRNLSLCAGKAPSRQLSAARPAGRRRLGAGRGARRPPLWVRGPAPTPSVPARHRDDAGSDSARPKKGGSEQPSPPPALPQDFGAPQGVAGLGELGVLGDTKLLHCPLPTAVGQNWLLPARGLGCAPWLLLCCPMWMHKLPHPYLLPGIPWPLWGHHPTPWGISELQRPHADLMGHLLGHHPPPWDIPQPQGPHPDLMGHPPVPGASSDPMGHLQTPRASS